MKNKLLIIFGVGILIRLILAFSSFHSDIQPFYFAGTVIAKGNILNFYDYLPKLPKTDPILKVYPTDLFNYPPLVYFSLGPVSYFSTLPFSQSILHNFIFNLPSVLGSRQLNWLLLVLKLPYLPFDLLTGYLLYRIFRDPKQKLWALTIWMFNPVALFATYMMGQFDIIPTFLSVLALYLILKKDVGKSSLILESVVLGLGASFKVFPFLFIVPLLLLKTKWVDRLKIVGTSLGVYILTILPFLSSKGFRATALVAGQTTKSLYPKIDISGGESILLFPAFLLFFYILFYLGKNLNENLWQKFFVILILFFVFTHTHPQWFLWITPFIVIDLVESNLKHWPLAALSLVSWLGLVTFFDPGLTVWLFSPIFPKLYNMPGIWDILKFKIDVNFARSIFQTIFVGTGMYYIYFYSAFRKQE